MVDAGCGGFIPAGGDCGRLLERLAQAAPSDARTFRSSETAGLLCRSREHLPRRLFATRCVRESIADFAHDSASAADDCCSAAALVGRSLPAAAARLTGPRVQGWFGSISELERARELWPQTDTSHRLLGCIHFRKGVLACPANV